MAGELEAAGLRLIPTGLGEWAFVPLVPTIARQPDGAAAMSLLEVGPGHLLTVGARLGVSDAQQAAARAELAQRAGLEASAVRLVPALLLAPSACLLLDADGARTQLARSATSGGWPFDAAFHAQLTAEQADAVRAAWGGRRGLLALRYEATIAAGSADGGITRSSSTSSSTSSTTTVTTRTTTGGAVTGSSSSSSEHTVGEAADDAPPPTPAPLAIELDGADWAAPHN